VLVRGDEGPAPLLGEVFELGVLGSDEVQLLFAGDGRIRRQMSLDRRS